MKIKNLLFVIIMSLGLNSNSQDKKVDSLFLHHFNILDSIVINCFFDPTLKCVESINFFETNTGIICSFDGTYAGKVRFAFQDLLNWHIWYCVNKKNLYFDEINKKIILR
jgi:hypothetical protein